MDFKSSNLSHIAKRPLIAVLIVGGLSVCPSRAALAQGATGLLRYTEPAVGGTHSSTSTPPASLLNQNVNSPRFSVDPTGKACISINARSEPQTTDQTLYTHILLLRNGCARQIKLKVCYYKTDHCVMMAIDAYRREQRNLGIFPSRDFRFEYQELVM